MVYGGVQSNPDELKMKQIRIDVYLVEKGHVPSRTKAQELIRSGLVSIRKNFLLRTVQSVSELVDEDLNPEIIIQKSALDKYVSRAGLKMEGALDHLKFAVDGLMVLDVGISTGGFTDCLLQRNAASVVGVDVGHNQLSLRLKNDPRIRCLEGVNAREIQNNSELLSVIPAGGFHLAVIDVSFISLSLILPSVSQVIKTWGHVLALVKPQFEVGQENLGKRGIVKDETLFAKVEDKIKKSAESSEFSIKDYFPSKIEGKDGNREFFIFAQKK